MSEIRLESGVPIPAVPRTGRAPRYPFLAMEVGQSFFIPGASTNTIHSALGRFMKSPEGKDRKYVSRSMTEVVPAEADKGEQDGVRVWRTE